jgi:hypothetical protein
VSDSYDLSSLHRAAADGDHLAQCRLDQITFEAYLTTLITIRECVAHLRLEQLAASLTEPLETDVRELPERFITEVELEPPPRKRQELIDSLERAANAPGLAA